MSNDCAACNSGADAFFAKIDQQIAEYGWSVIATGTQLASGEVSMAYTIGLADKGFPEIIVFGLPAHIAQVLLNEAAFRLLKNELPLGVKVDDLANLPTFFRSVEPEVAAPYIIQANNRAGKELPALQLVWPDRAGKLPWEEGADPAFKAVQPELFSQLN